MAQHDDLLEDDLMGDDDLEDVSDEDLLLDDESEVVDGIEGDPLLEAEKEAMANDEFDEPEALGDSAHGDSGYSDEEAWPAEEFGRGAGAGDDEEDIEALGYRVIDTDVDNRDDIL